MVINGEGVLTGCGLHGLFSLTPPHLPLPGGTDIWYGQ